MILIQANWYRPAFSLPTTALLCTMQNTQQLSALTTVRNHNMLLRISLTQTGNLCIAHTASTPHLLLFSLLQVPLYLLLVQQLRKTWQHFRPLTSLPGPGKSSPDVTSPDVAKASTFTWSRIYLFIHLFTVLRTTTNASWLMRFCILETNSLHGTVPYSWALYLGSVSELSSR